LASVNEQARRGKRLALQFAMVQMACAGVAALACGLGAGLNAARSAIVGGLIMAAGTLVFAWRLFASGWPAAGVARGLYVGELLKWLWVIVALWLAFTRGGFEAWALMTGLLLAQVGFWIAIGIFKS
jgi:F0F1-type ATP synthase assembly protein I